MGVSALAVGQIRWQERLGTRAAYRVCDWDEELVQVEVVEAPRLQPGQKFRFMRAAVLAMNTQTHGA
jgi:hypothetical protein